MKKSFKIFLFIVLAFVVLIFAAWLLRNSMLGYFLSKQVYDQSDGKAELAISGVHLNIKDGNIILDKPVFTFDSLFIDKQHQYKLQQIVFDTIALERVSFFELLWNKKFRARRLRIEKPQIRFEGGLLRGKSDFRPDSLFAMISKRRENKTKADVRINLVSIHYGRISFSSDTVKSHISNLVDFTIEMYNLNTSPTPEIAEKQILFCDDLLFEITHLNNRILPGYIVNLDRALLSVKKQKVIIDNLSISPKWQNEKGKSKINLKARKILMNGLDLSKAENLGDVGMSSIRISDGYVTYYLPKGVELKSDTLSKNELGRLQQKIKIFILDSLRLKRMSFYNVRNEEDTITAVRDIDLKIHNLVIDSATLLNPMRLLKSGYSILNTGKSQFYIPEKNLITSFSNFGYSSKTGSLNIRNIRIASDTTKSVEIAELFLGKLSVEGLFPEKYKPGRPISIGVSLIGLQFTVDLNNPLFNVTGGNFSLQDHFLFNKVSVRDAYGKIYQGGRFALDVSGLDFACDHLSIPQEDASEYRFDNPVLNVRYIKGFADNKKYLFSTGKIHFRNKILTINDVKSNMITKKKEEKVSLGFDFAAVRGFDLMMALNRKEILLDSLDVRKPVVRGTLFLTGKTGNEQQKFALDLPVTLGIKHLGLSDAVLKLNLKNDKQKPVEFSTNINVSIQDIYPGSRLDSSLIDNLKGTVEFLNMDAGLMEHRSKVQTLAINLSEHSLKLQNLKISGNDGKSAGMPFVVNQLDLKDLEVSGLNYPLLVKYDSIVFGKLSVNDIQSDITLRQNSRKETESNPETSTSKRLFNMVYDSITVNHIFSNVSYVGDSANSAFRLADLYIAHYNGSNASNNLIRNLKISFDSLVWRDSLNNTSLAIYQAWSDPAVHTLTIKNIRAGNLFRKQKDIKLYDSAGFRFNSDHVVFSGINLNQTLPTRLTVDKLAFDHMNFFLILKKAKEKKRTGFDLDMGFIQSYAGLMASLRVDTTYLKDISLQYYTIGDSSVKSVKVDDIALKVRGINIDTSMASLGMRDMVKNMTIDLRGRSYITSDSMYEIQSGLIRYDFPEKAIVVDSFYVMPRYPRKTFFEKARYQTDRVKLFGKRMELRDFDFDDFFDNDHIHFGLLKIDQADLRLYRDMKYPLKPGIYKPMPQEILRSLTQKITIDTVEIMDSYLLYGEYSKKSENPGIAYFEHFNIMAYHLTNNFSVVPDTTNLFVRLNTKVMGDARMDASIWFPLHSTEDEFSLTASSERMDMTKLRQLTENILGISIVSGKGRIVYSDIRGNNVESSGTMLFKYRKFKLKMYNTEKSKVSSGFFAPVFNFMINGLMIKSYNPRFARTPRKGVVYYKRDSQRSVVNYLWKSLLSGMLSTMGINTKEQRQQKKIIKKEGD